MGKNELFGWLNLNVSKDVNSNKTMDVLEAAYALNSDNIDKVDLVITDDEGNQHVLRVNGWELNWERFYEEGEF